MTEPTTADPDIALGSETPTDADTATRTYVTFDLAEQTFGVDVAHVREILNRQKVSRLPGGAPDCQGVIDTAGEAIPLIDLAGRLGLPGTEPGAETRIVVFEIVRDGHKLPIGILADRVLDVTQIADTDIEPAPTAALGSIEGHGIKGLTRLDGALVVLLDVDRIFHAGDAMTM